MDWKKCEKQPPAEGKPVLIYSKCDGFGVGYCKYGYGAGKVSYYWKYKNIQQSDKVEDALFWCELELPPESHE
jgi:hypothetical protein